MHGVEMAVELQRRPGLGPGEAHDHGRRGRMSGSGPFDDEAVIPENAGQPIKDAAGLAGPAWDGDQLHGGVEQPVPIDRLSQERRRGKCGLHDAVL